MQQQTIQQAWEWSEHLVLFEDLPGLILNCYKFLPSTTDEKKKVRELKFKYATIAQWLDFLIPGDNPLNIDLFSLEKIKFKTYAEESKAVLNLAVELFPRVEALREYFATPSHVWFAWEVDILNRSMLKSGLLTGEPARDVSKEKLEGFKEKMNELIQELGKLKLLRFASDSGHISDSSKFSKGSAVELIICWTGIVAAEDSSFRNSSAYSDFCRKSTTHLRNLRRNKDFQISLLENGKELPEGRNRPREAKKVRRFE